MVEVSTESAIHNLDEIISLEKHLLNHLQPGAIKTVKLCGKELYILALYYKNYIYSQRLGLDAVTCREIENYFNNIASAMDTLLSSIKDPPIAAQLIFKGYEHAHASWFLDWDLQSPGKNDVMMQLWHDGNAANWFLAEEHSFWGTGDGSSAPNKSTKYRVDEMVHLAKLMRRLSQTYQDLTDNRVTHNGIKVAAFNEKDALVFNLADLIKKQGRAVSQVVEIASAIHEWAASEPNPQQPQFMAAFKKWKERP